MTTYGQGAKGQLVTVHEDRRAGGDRLQQHPLQGFNDIDEGPERDGAT